MEMDTDPLEGSSYNVGVSVKAEIKNEEDDHYNTMRKVYRVSWGQLEILSNFFNSNKSIAIGINRTLQAKEHAREKWRGVADLLNAERGGIRKDFTGWAKYWLDYKGKLKKRAAALRASRAKNAKKPSTEIFFNEVEKKFLQILGEDIGEPLPTVQAEQPPKTGTASTNADVHDSSASEFMHHDPEDDNPIQNPPSEPNLEPQHQSHAASTHVNMQNSSTSDFIFLDPGPVNHTQNAPSEPILEPLPQNHNDSTHMNMHNSSTSEFIFLDPEDDNPTQNPPSEPILEPLPQTHAASTHMDMNDPSAYKFIFLDPEVDNPTQNPPLQPSLEPLPQTHAAASHMDMHDPSAYKFILLDPEAVNHTQNPPSEPSLEPLPQTHTASTHVNNSSAPEFLLFGPRVVNPAQNPPLESRLQPQPQTYAASTHVHDSSASESFHLDPTVHNPPLEPLPQNPPLEPVVQDPPAHSSSRGPTLRRATPPAARSRLWRRRRVPSLSQEAARRALVRSTQMHAKAAVRIAEAMEKMVQTSTALGNTASRIERALLELAQCVQTNQEPIEFNSTDAMMDPKTGLMICLHCLEDFDPSLLSDHMINTHNYRRVLFKCHLCQNTFQERKLLMIHRQECQPEPKVRKRKTFQQIMREVESKYFLEEQEDLLEPVACPICLLELPKYCLKEHLLNEHRKPDVILTCGRCNRNFKSKLTLREHVKLVHEAIEDSEECELCGQKFRSLKYLSNHKRNVHPSGNKIHKCAVCGKEFKSRLCLHQHSKYVHPPESASVECPHCPNKMFKSRINLTQHLKVSHGWKRK